MSKKSTAEIEKVREGHAMALRIVADLHAAYGKGVDIAINAAGEDSTWLYLHGTGDTYVAAFWDDNMVFDASEQNNVEGGHLIVLEHVRTFLHEHGYGPRT